MTNNNVRSAFDRELQTVQNDLLRMGSLLNSAIDRSMKALANRDLALARQVVADDAEVNALRFHIEEECTVIIATQQPAAGDLRALVAAMNIVSDLERMADHAEGIGRINLLLGDEPLPRPLGDISEMAEKSVTPTET